MSKFIEQVTQEILYLRTPDKWIKLLSANQDIDRVSLPSHSELHRYRFSVNYTVTTDCLPKHVQSAQNNFINQLKHDIYGDFVGRIYEMQRAIFERDEEKALSICNDLISETIGNK